ncbi:hypothetical protein [Streptomyces sp. NPDC001833]
MGSAAGSGEVGQVILAVTRLRTTAQATRGRLAPAGVIKNYSCCE